MRTWTLCHNAIESRKKDRPHRKNRLNFGFPKTEWMRIEKRHDVKVFKEIHEKTLVDPYTSAEFELEFSELSWAEPTYKCTEPSQAGHLNFRAESELSIFFWCMVFLTFFFSFLLFYSFLNPKSSHLLTKKYYSLQRKLKIEWTKGYPEQSAKSSKNARKNLCVKKRQFSEFRADLFFELEGKCHEPFWAEKPSAWAMAWAIICPTYWTYLMYL